MTTPNRLALSAPLERPDVPVVELVARTRRTESRTILAIVAALRDHGVPIRDMAVVVRDLDQYELPLARAALQYGITPALWTQLRVTQTRPYALVESICNVLGADELDRETLFRPLSHRWAPPDATVPDWPIDPKTVQTAAQRVPNGVYPIDQWADELRSVPDLDDRIVDYVEWVEAGPDPTPEAVTAVLGDVVDAYESVGLSRTNATDGPALLATETEARAVVRMNTLVEQLRHKYADRLDEGTFDESWHDVAQLCELVATQRPGHRDHSNARALDVLEANDIWALDVPYVIAAGLIDGEWPQETESTVPAELQEVILAGEQSAGILAPRAAWTDGRDRDQFDDTLRAAGNCLILTRHTESTEMAEKHPSPLLAQIDVETVSDRAHRQLLSADRVLPAAIGATLQPTEDDDATPQPTEGDDA